MKISIAIANYQGRSLLQDNLPNILASGADEVIINDDASNDGSAEFIRENFPTVKLLVSQKNRRFIDSANKLFNEATGDIVVLLNNDVKVEKDFLKPLVEHFKDKDVFAVNCHEIGEGFSVAFWNNGFFEYKRGQEANYSHKSSWASGGSAAFRKSTWQKLGGFDPIFYPGYWEDIDLSFRAIKQGHQVLWEPGSKVYHNHGTTFSKILNKRKMEWIQQRNQLIFIWKNIDDPNMRNEHNKALAKRLLGGMGFGYWIPFLWALIRFSGQHLHGRTKDVLTDLEAINYVNS